MDTSTPPPTAAAGSIAPLFTPINVVLLIAFSIMIYLKLKPAPPPHIPRPTNPIVFQTFTPPTLAAYNGTADQPIYFAVRGRVFDVSPGKNFYGPGGPYENFAGRDASRGLAKGSFDEDMLTKDLQGPLDKLDDLDKDELEALADWEQKFLEKYLVVGRLVAVGDHKKSEASKTST